MKSRPKTKLVCASLSCDGFDETSFLRFGAGTTDHSIILNGMNALGYDGYAAIEFPPQPYSSTLEDDLRRAKQMFEPYLK
jgi:hypothetical protein